MRKLLFLSMVAAAAIMSFTSCDEVKDAIDDIQNDQEPRIEESSNGLEMNVSYKKKGVGINYTATFKAERNDTICTSFLSKTTYPAADLAKFSYDELTSDSTINKENCKLDGKAITINYPEYVGMPKFVVKGALTAAYEAFRNGGQILNNVVINAQGNN